MSSPILEVPPGFALHVLQLVETLKLTKTPSKQLTN